MNAGSKSGAKIALSCMSCWMRCRIASRFFRSGSAACSEEPVDVGVAAVGVHTVRQHERFDAGRGVAKRGAAGPVQILELLFLVALDHRGPLERLHLDANADGL